MIERTQNIRFGGHIPAREGLKRVAVDVRGMGYNVVQILVGGIQDWTTYDIDDQSAMEYRKLMYGIETYVHLPVIINPCDEEKHRMGKVILRKHAKIARNLSARGLVLHPGFKKENEEKDAMKNLLKFCEGALREDEEIPILLETDSGSKNGSKIGSLDFIDKALDGLNPHHFGMCVDTAHLYGRGVDLWDSEVRAGMLAKYAKRIKFVHLNVPDANVTLGSFMDRHNTPFEECPRDSTGLIRDMVSNYPCVLERRSLHVQEKDAAFIRKLMAPPVRD